MSTFAIGIHQLLSNVHAQRRTNTQHYYSYSPMLLQCRLWNDSPAKRCRRRLIMITKIDHKNLTMNESAEVADGLKTAVVKNSARWNAQSAMTYTVHCIAIWRASSDQLPKTRFGSNSRCTSASCRHKTTCTPRIDPNTHDSSAIRPNPTSWSN